MHLSSLMERNIAADLNENGNLRRVLSVTVTKVQA